MSDFYAMDMFEPVNLMLTGAKKRLDSLLITRIPVKHIPQEEVITVTQRITLTPHTCSDCMRGYIGNAHICWANVDDE